MAAGTPVIAYHAGGALDTVVAGETGLFFDEQTADSLAEAIQAYESTQLDPQVAIRHAVTFSEAAFIGSVVQFVAARWPKG